MRINEEQLSVKHTKVVGCYQPLSNSPDPPALASFAPARNAEP